MLERQRTWLAIDGIDEATTERLSIEQLHRQELFAFVIPDIEHTRDIPVGDTARQTYFVAEVFDHRSVAEQLFAQHFERNQFAQLDIAGTIDAAAGTDAQQFC